MVSIFKRGQIVERKNCMLDQELAHRVPPGTIGICSGKEKVHSGITVVEVLFVQPVDRLGMNPRQSWWVRPEFLIPRDDLMSGDES